MSQYDIKLATLSSEINRLKAIILDKNKTIEALRGDAGLYADTQTDPWLELQQVRTTFVVMQAYIQRHMERIDNIAKKPSGG